MKMKCTYGDVWKGTLLWNPYSKSNHLLQMSSIYAHIGSLNSIFGWDWLGLKVAGGAVVAALFLLYRNQDSLLYFPNPPNFPKIVSDNPKYFRSPDEWSTQGIPLEYSKTSAKPIPFENVEVKTPDGAILHCWLLLQETSGSSVPPTLIYFHGNAGNMGFRLRNAAEMYGRAGINVLMVDYRGFGEY